MAIQNNYYTQAEDGGDVKYFDPILGGSTSPTRAPTTSSFLSRSAKSFCHSDRKLRVGKL